MKKLIALLCTAALLFACVLPASAAENDDLAARFEAYYEKFMHEVEPTDLVAEKIADLRGGEVEMYLLYDKNDQNVYEPIPRWSVGPYFYYHHDPGRMLVAVLSDEVHRAAMERDFHEIEIDPYMSWPTLKMDDIVYLTNYGILTDADMDELMQVENDAFSIDRLPESTIINALYDHVKDEVDFGKEDLAYETLLKVYGSYLYRIYDKNNPDVPDAPYTQWVDGYYVTYDGPMTLVTCMYDDDEIYVGNSMVHMQQIAMGHCEYISAVPWESVATEQIGQRWRAQTDSTLEAPQVDFLAGANMEEDSFYQVYDPQGISAEDKQIYHVVDLPYIASTKTYMIYNNAYGDGENNVGIWKGREAKAYSLREACEKRLVNYEALHLLARRYGVIELVLVGDMDQDGKQGVADILDVKGRIMAGKDTVQAVDYDFIGDLDEDGKLSVSDILMLKDIIMKSN